MKNKELIAALVLTFGLGFITGIIAIQIISVHGTYYGGSINHIDPVYYLGYGFLFGFMAIPFSIAASYCIPKYHRLIRRLNYED